MLNSNEIQRSWIDRIEALHELQEQLLQLGQLDIAVDVETTGIDLTHDTLVGFSLCWSPDNAVYVDCVAIPPAAAGAILFDILLAANTIVGHNIYYFDRHILARYTCPITRAGAPELHDTLIAAYCTGHWAEEIGTGSKPLSLKTLSRRLLDFRQTTLPELFGELLPDHVGDLDFSLLPQRHDSVLRYVTDDAWCTYMIACQLIPWVAEREGCQLVYDLERKLAPYAQAIQDRGVLIDRPYLELQGERLKNARSVLDAWLREYAGLDDNFNFGSPQHMQWMLYTRMALEAREYSKPTTRYPKGQPKTDERTINTLVMSDAVPVDCVPWLRNHLTLKAIDKSINQYFAGLPKHIQEDGAIRCSYRQFGTATGRFSSARPNLQNISRKEEWQIHGRIACTVSTNTRKCFVPRPGCYFLDSDYNAIEARILASASQDPAYMQVFRTGGDIHFTTAALMFEIPREDVTKEQRQRAKTVVYGWGFGQEVEQMAKANNMTLQLTQMVHGRFVRTFHVLVNWRLLKVDEWYTRQGWAYTHFGRPRFLPQYRHPKRHIRGMGERAGFNHYVQGTAADIQKLALLNICRMLERDYGTAPESPRIIMHTHDSNLIEVPDAIKAEELTPKVHKCMQIHVADNWLPFVVDSKVCRSLG